MSTILRLVSTLLIPLLLINICLAAVAPVLAYAGEEKITRFAPEIAESEPIEEEEEGTNWWPWAISAAVLGFIVAGMGGMKGHSDSGGSDGAIDVGW
jgi:ABC-type transporter Mla maintaining outer membrane lipid asymmetry permease subunit MlaE